MFSNYFKIACRNIIRQKGFSAIKISGLAIGLACCLLITLWVQDELSYDRYHENSDRICRISQEFESQNYYAHFARVAYGYVNALPDEFEEIEDLVRIGHELKVVVKYGDKKYNEPNFFQVDKNLFDVFNFELLIGDPESVLQDRNSILITERIAKKYFGTDDPIGQTITTLGQMAGSDKTYKVTGILAETRSNSHFHFDFLAAQDDSREEMADNWNYIYVLLDEKADYRLVEEKFDDFIGKHVGPNAVGFQKLHLQPLTDIHLHSQLDREIEPNGDILYIYIFVITAVIILLLACINFMNLTIARSLRRSIEAGIRKTAGASRNQLIIQFLVESLLLNLAALTAAFILLELSLPIFNDYSGKTLTVFALLDWKYIVGLIYLVIITSLISGGYPALYFSLIKPASILKGKSGLLILPGKSKFSYFSIKNVLVVLQFSAAIILIICCIISNSQHGLMMSEKLGKQGDVILALPKIPDAAKVQYSTYKSELLKHSDILEVSASMEEPSRQTLDAMNFDIEGVNTVDQDLKLFVLPVDSNFVEFMGLEMTAGSSFLEPGISANGETYILNETAVKSVGWDSVEQAIGKKFKPLTEWAKFEGGTIIGVVKDFGQSSLRKEIKPLVLFQKPIWYFCFLVKINSSNVASALRIMETEWNNLNPEYPFEYHFVDDLFAGIYQAEQKQAEILGIFSMIGLFIACLGLFGLTAYSVERRQKEIGIRKVLGATISNIVGLMTKEFIILVFISNIISWPIAYYVMNKWLENFAYRTDIRIATFLLAGFSALFIALLTVSYQALKAARANPVNAIQHE